MEGRDGDGCEDGRMGDVVMVSRSQVVASELPSK